KISIQIKEMKKKIERLEERYVLEEITQDIFVKYQEKFRQGIRYMHLRLEKITLQVSNLEECIDEVLYFAGNLPIIWEKSGYKEKIRLQNLIFPEGITYDKRNNQCRTTTIK